MRTRAAASASASHSSTRALCRRAMARAGWPRRSASSTTTRVKPAPDHFGCRRPLRKLGKERVDQLCGIGRALETLQPRNRKLAGMRERRGDQIVFARKVLIERALSNARPRGDIVHRHPQKSLTPEQPVGCVEDANSGLSTRTPHELAPLVYSAVNLHPDRRGGQIISTISRASCARKPDHAAKAHPAIHRRPGGVGAAAAAGRLQGRPVQGLAADPDRPAHP